jgi:hypothetical protein
VTPPRDRKNRTRVRTRISADGPARNHAKPLETATSWRRARRAERTACFDRRDRRGWWGGVRRCGRKHAEPQPRPPDTRGIAVRPQRCVVPLLLDSQPCAGTARDSTAGRRSADCARANSVVSAPSGCPEELDRRFPSCHRHARAPVGALAPPLRHIPRTRLRTFLSARQDVLTTAAVFLLLPTAGEKEETVRSCYLAFDGVYQIGDV